MITKNELLMKLREMRADINGESGWHHGRLTMVAQLQDWAHSLPNDPTDDPETVVASDSHREDALRYVTGIDFAKPGQVFQHRNITVLPSPVQPEPSALEIAVRIYLNPGMRWAIDECSNIACALVDAVRADEARRAQNP